MSNERLQALPPLVVKLVARRYIEPQNAEAQSRFEHLVTLGFARHGAWGRYEPTEKAKEAVRETERRLAVKKAMVSPGGNPPTDGETWIFIEGSKKKELRVKYPEPILDHSEEAVRALWSSATWKEFWSRIIAATTGVSGYEERAAAIRQGGLEAVVVDRTGSPMQPT